jgi:hypothetical protein
MAKSSASIYKQNEHGEYVCPDCGVTKNRKNTMFYHMKTHTGEKNYVCTVPGCDKAFVQKSGLTQHMRQLHPAQDKTVATTYACPCCDHTAAIKSNLMIHIGRKHGADWIPAREADGTCKGCSHKDCSRSFASPTAYFYHAVGCFVAAAPEPVRAFLRADTDLCGDPLPSASTTAETETRESSESAC